MDNPGWLPGIRHIPSPNCNARPDNTLIELLVVHNMTLPPNEFGGDDIIRLFTNTLDEHAHPVYRSLRGLQVSSHFLIRRDGEVIQFVSTLMRAWHAGVSCWRGRTQCNDFSMGIEFEGTDTVPFTEQQYRAGAFLVEQLTALLPLKFVVGHEHIAPGRKTDPGPCFDWDGWFIRLPPVLEKGFNCNPHSENKV